MSSRTTITSPQHRRLLATVAGLAGVGATLSFLALTADTSDGGTILAPMAGTAGASVAASAAAPAAPVAAAPLRAVPAAPAAAPAPAPAARVAPKAAPAPAPAPAHAMAPAATSCAGAGSSVDAFMTHLNAAHLELSPTEQVADAADVDAYAKTHTVLLGNMLAPVLGGVTDSADAFLQHVYAAHLELSPTEQVADAADVDQYTKTHTVMLENMAKPLIGC